MIRGIIMKYPKINTLYKRNGKGIIIPEEYSKEEFENIVEWYVTEKIDGTNIRVCYSRIDITLGSKDCLEFKGRTDNAQIPKHLDEYLHKKFEIEKIKEVFTYRGEIPNDIIIYGEGYGPKIQGGGKYRKDVSFICFDIQIDSMWLEPELIKELCKKLNIEYVPEIGCPWEKDIVQLVKRGFKSLINSSVEAEGVVVRPKPLMLFRNGEPIKWKLKTKDFRKLEANKK
jgi:hypothetical protein